MKREEAVSEVIGTILVLAITVVLFAAVFFYVQQFPLASPSEQITVYPEISYNPESHVLFENLSVKAGSIILRSETYLIVIINNVEHTNQLTNITILSPYGSTSRYLEPGDSIQWNSTSIRADVTDNSTVTSILFYKPSSQVLWQSKNNLSSQQSISAFYVTPSPIIANKSYTIVIQVNTFDPNGTEVYLNLTSLYGTEFNTSMSLYRTSGDSAIFYYYGNSPHSLPVNCFAYVTVITGGIALKSELDLS